MTCSETAVEVAGQNAAPRETSAGTPSPRIAAVILAAGRSTRMGGSNKLLSEVDGVPMLLRAVGAACASVCRPVVVVTGFDAERVAALLAGHGQPLSIVYNAAFADGLSTSLRAGLRALPADIDGALVMLADMPGVGAIEVDRLVSAFDPAAPAIVVPFRRGRRGNPVLWPRRHFAEMQALTGDVGARALLDRHADRITRVEFDSDAIFADIDTPEALQGIERR
jgi:molybdenum cofactor cytidylyltransferase